MFTNPGFTLADQLFWIVDCFCKTMAPEARKLGALSGALWNRVRGFERRFSRLYAMWKAGTLPKARVRAVADASPRPLPTDALGAVTTRPASLLPRGLRWLQKTLPHSAGALRAGVESLLWNYPETKEFVAACPQVGRVLRPMCRMAGMKPPEWLALPKRVRRSDPPPRPSPSRGEGEDISPRPTGSILGSSPRTVAEPPSPHGGEGEGPPPHPSPASAGEGASGGNGAGAQRRRRRTPLEIADALVRWSERTGKPINIAKVSPVVWGCIVHRPRDGNCPPPEIGYGGRRKKPPKDYEPPRDWD